MWASNFDKMIPYNAYQTLIQCGINLPEVSIGTIGGRRESEGTRSSSMPPMTLNPKTPSPLRLIDTSLLARLSKVDDVIKILKHQVQQINE